MNTLGNHKSRGSLGSYQPWLQNPLPLWVEALEMVGLEQNSTEGQEVRKFLQHRDGIGTAVVGNGLDPFPPAYSESYLFLLLSSCEIIILS